MRAKAEHLAGGHSWSVGSLTKAEGIAEADETFIGGLSKNMHKNKRESTGKTAVMGILERKGKNERSRVRARVVHSLDKATLQKEIRNVIVPKSTVNTDAWGAYSGLSKNFQHEVIDHDVVRFTPTA